MRCENVKACACPKTTSENNGKCCACVIKHKETDSLPFCLFLDNGGDKSVANYYRKLGSVDMSPKRPSFGRISAILR